MEPVSIKAMSVAIGAFLASIILEMFSVPPEAFVAGLIGTLIGEFAREKTSFKQAVLAIISITIVAGWLGQIAIEHFHSYKPTSILGLLALILSYYREKLINEVGRIIRGASDGLIAWFKHKGSGQ